MGKEIKYLIIVVVLSVVALLGLYFYSSTFFLELRCLESCVSFIIPLRKITCRTLVCSSRCLKLMAVCPSISEKSPEADDMECMR